MPHNAPLPAPYQQLVAELVEKDVVVLEHISAHPALHAPYATDFLLVVFMHQGEIRNHDGTHLILQPRDVSLLMPSQVLLPVSVTDDLCYSAVAVSRKFYKTFLLQYPYKRYDALFHRRPLCRLSEEQLGNVLDAVNLLRTIARGNSPFRQEQLLQLLGILYNMLGEYYVSTTPEERRKRQVVFGKFYDALMEHHCHSHEVAFYARICCLSPKHFSEVVKAETSMSANEWIDTFVLMSAKSLLDTRKDLSLQQIGRQVGFHEQTTFTRFFKRKTGMTPSEYRQRR